MINYILKLHAIQRSNSSNVFAENLPSFLKAFFEKRRLYWDTEFFSSAMLLVHLSGLGGQQLSPLISLCVFIIWCTWCFAGKLMTVGVGVRCHTLTSWGRWPLLPGWVRGQRSPCSCFVHLSCSTATYWYPATPACIGSCYKIWNRDSLGRNH